MTKSLIILKFMKLIRRSQFSNITEVRFEFQASAKTHHVSIATPNLAFFQKKSAILLIKVVIAEYSVKMAQDLNIYDEIEIEDMTFDKTLQIYHYPCPCGDRFEIGIADLRDGEEIAVCPSCSLMIKVVFDLVLLALSMIPRTPLTWLQEDLPEDKPADGTTPTVAIQA